MGGEPLFALNLVGFPTKALPLEVLGEILAGGAAVAAEAGVPILGGHSTDFDVPVYGMAVTGRAKASRLRRNVGARRGRRARPHEGARDGDPDGRAPRPGPARGLDPRAPRARRGPDGRRGSGSRRVDGPPQPRGGARGGRVRRLRVDGRDGLRSPRPPEGDARSGRACPPRSPPRRCPSFPARGASSRTVSRRTARGATSRRRGPSSTWRRASSETDLLLAADAQTSGGLLLAVAGSQAEALVSALRAAGDTPAAVVGRFLGSEAASRAIRVVA